METLRVFKGNRTIRVEVSRDNEVACGVSASWQSSRLAQLLQNELGSDQFEKFKDAFNKIVVKEKECKEKSSKLQCTEDRTCEYNDKSGECDMSLLFNGQQLLKLYGGALQIGEGEERNATQHGIARNMLEQAIQCNLETYNQLSSDRTLFPQRYQVYDNIHYWRRCGRLLLQRHPALPPARAGNHIHGTLPPPYL